MHFLKFIFAVQIPQNQIDQLVFHLHLFLVNFDADSGVVFVGKDAAHEEAIGKVPFVIVLNKVDLKDSWEVDDRTIEELTSKGWHVFQSSAKTGQGVEEAFALLAKQMLPN